MTTALSQIVWFEHAFKRGDAVLEREFAFFHASDEQLIAVERTVQAGDGFIEIVVFIMQASEPFTQGRCRIENIVVYVHHHGLVHFDGRSAERYGMSLRTGKQSLWSPFPMNKAFVRESEDDDDGEESLSPALRLPPGSKNYMTPRGYQALRGELDQLLRVERPKIVEIVAWAAGNGDRSENGDYIYGKKRLREIDRRVRFLTKRIDNAEIVDPRVHQGGDQIFFGATVKILDTDAQPEAGDGQVWQIVGIDEADVSTGRISWVSPLARALLKAREGEIVRFMSPSGVREVEIVEVRYE